MVTAKTLTSDRCQSDETRCECGQLIAKIVEVGLELKCKRCKRIVTIPFASIQGWNNVAS
jgi:phage FluMu protein Com